MKRNPTQFQQLGIWSLKKGARDAYKRYEQSTDITKKIFGMYMQALKGRVRQSVYQSFSPYFNIYINVCGYTHTHPSGHLWPSRNTVLPEVK